MSISAQVFLWVMAAVCVLGMVTSAAGANTKGGAKGCVAAAAVLFNGLMTAGLVLIATGVWR